MSLPTQPLPASPVASSKPSPNGDLERLLTLWRDLALQTAQAAAHNGSDELTLLDLQLQVEQAITDRHPETSRFMDALLAWNSTLAHHGSGPVTTCLQCRRARVGSPDNLPFVTPRAGVR